MEYSTLLLEIFTLAGVTATALTCSSSDNVLLLMTFLSANPHKKIAILSGYIAANLCLLCVCILGVFVAATSPVRWLDFLGVIPLGIGCLQIYKLFQSNKTLSNSSEIKSTGLLTIMGIQLANSGDTAAIFIPLFAETRPSMILALTFSFLLTAFGLACAALILSRLAWLQASLSRWGQLVTPIIMIGIGCYILNNSITDRVPGY